jgi:hypothetical protein
MYVLVEGDGDGLNYSRDSKKNSDKEIHHRPHLSIFHLKTDNDMRG